MELRLWLRLFSCSRLIENDIRRHLNAEFEFSLPRFDILAQLDRADEGLVLGEVSKRLMVSAGNITSLVEGLVKSGHITRTTSSGDRRAQVIRLTDKGRREFRRMKLLEVVVPPNAAPETVATGFALARKLGKIAVRAGVCDGFIGNRILSAYRKQAEYLMEDGAAPAEIDAAFRGFGLPMPRRRNLVNIGVGRDER